MSYELHGDTGTRLYRIWKTMNMPVVVTGGKKKVI